MELTYVAAFHIARRVKEDNEVLEEIRTVGESSFLPYFVAGLRKWTDLDRHFDRYYDNPVFALEANSPTVSHYHNRHYRRQDTSFSLLQSAKLQMKQLQSAVLPPSARSETDKQDWKHGPQTSSSLTDREFATAYDSYTWGRSLFFSQGFWDIGLLKRHNSSVVEYVARGVIAASEFMCTTHDKGYLTYPPYNLKVRMEVVCKTTELDFFMSLPYSILRRVSKLTFQSWSVGMQYDTSDLAEYAEPLTELLEQNTALESLEFDVQDSTQFNKDITAMILRKLQNNITVKEVATGVSNVNK